MPVKPMFSANIGEWRTVISALRHYQQHLDESLPETYETDEEFIRYDDFERLERLIPSFDRQLAAYIQEADSDFAVKDHATSSNESALLK